MRFFIGKVGFVDMGYSSLDCIYHFKSTYEVFCKRQSLTLFTLTSYAIYLFLYILMKRQSVP